MKNPKSKIQNPNKSYKSKYFKFLSIGILFVICYLSFVVVLAGCVPSNKEENPSNKKVLFYRNPMNPQITSPVPMKDNMGMDYVPVYKEKEEEKATETSDGSVKISAEKQQLIGVKTEIAKRINLYKLINTVGRIAYDPDLYNAQNEYIGALKGDDSDLIDSAKTRLKLLGISERQINKITSEDAADKSLILPEGRAWVYAEIFESDMPYVKIGQTLKVTSGSLPGKTFSGIISSIDTVIDPNTRTIKIRASLNNASGSLTPQMFVNAEIFASLGNKLAVSRDAVLNSGERQTIFVDKGNGYFEPRIVTLGVTADPYVEILSGIKSGEKVVTSGNFLIDSESRLRGK